MERLMQSEAREVFRFFAEFSKIPHGSGNMNRISDYLVDFAKSRGLTYVQDDAKNVIIIKEATSGYEEEEPLLLQGHMDMVAVKKPECTKDLMKEGIDLCVDGDYLYAKDTSLGGDDGIAVAYMLAILDSDAIAHPRIEAIITVDEEVGLLGAKAIDLSVCKGRRLLNMDSEQEGIFTVSCAGGARIHCTLPVERTQTEGVKYAISVEGLQGGHSGGEIHKEKGNSNVLSGRILYTCQKAVPVQLVSMAGGLADNAISRETRMEVVVSKTDTEAFEEALKKVTLAIQKELATKDPDVTVVINSKEEGTFMAVTEADSKKAAYLLLVLPNGVQAMSADIAGLVQTSLNLGILKLEEEKLQLDYSVRSSVGSEKELLLAKVSAIVDSCGGSWEISGEYPAWEYRKDSVLRDKMVSLYEEMYGCKPEVVAIHAGLECGLFADKLKGLDCVSTGPQVWDVHTTEERLSISSAERVWKYILALLAKKD